MKKTLLALLVSTALISSCKKDEVAKPTPTPAPKPAGSKSFIKITINEKTIEARDTIVNVSASPTVESSITFYPMLHKYEVSQNVWNPATVDKTLAINSICGGILYNGKLKIVISATSYGSSVNSAIDSFRTLNNSATAFSIEDLTGETKVTYSISTGSKIYVTKFDDDVTEGTMKLNVKGPDGVEIPATGEFKIYKR